MYVCMYVYTSLVIMDISDWMKVTGQNHGGTHILFISSSPSTDTAWFITKMHYNIIIIIIIISILLSQFDYTIYMLTVSGVAKG